MTNIVEIRTYDDLLKINDYIDDNEDGATNYTFKLMNDLDLKGIDFQPLGLDSNCSFEGIFDGQGYTISNMIIDCHDENSVGFISVNYGIIKNLNFDNTCKIVGHNEIGNICGTNFGIIENCKSAAIINGNRDIGGICGFSYCEKMKNCDFYGMINGDSNIGGIGGTIIYNGYYKNFIDFLIS